MVTLRYVFRVRRQFEMHVEFFREFHVRIFDANEPTLANLGLHFKG